MVCTCASVPASPDGASLDVRALQESDPANAIQLQRMSTTR
jgi:hypothetical protein